MAVLLILASPHVLLEPSGAGARPVHPIRVISLLCRIWSLSGRSGLWKPSRAAARAITRSKLIALLGRHWIIGTFARHVPRTYLKIPDCCRSAINEE